jgi:hypothetical protein
MIEILSAHHQTGFDSGTETGSVCSCVEVPVNLCIHYTTVARWSGCLETWMSICRGFVFGTFHYQVTDLRQQELSQTQMHAHTNAQKHMQTHTHIHSCMHSHKHAHTRGNRHKQAQANNHLAAIAHSLPTHLNQADMDTHTGFLTCYPAHTCLHFSMYPHNGPPLTAWRCNGNILTF